MFLGQESHQNSLAEGPEDVLVVGHLPHHHHHVRDAVLHLRPDLDDAAVVGDELLGRDAEGRVADDSLDTAVQPGEDQDPAWPLGSWRYQ